MENEIERKYMKRYRGKEKLLPLRVGLT